MSRGKAPEPTPSRSERFRAEVDELLPAPSPGQRLLIEEVCRLVDRSDRYDALLRGDAECWLEVQSDIEGVRVLVVSSVATEARATVAELRQAVKALNLPAAPEVPVTGTVAEPKAGEARSLTVLLGTG